MFTKLFIFIGLFMLASLDALGAIKRVKIDPQDGGMTLRLVMDKPIALKTAPESDGVFVIDGFTLQDWGPDKQGSGQGDIKEYYVEDYSNGGAELVVRTTSGMTLASAQMKPRGSDYQYEVVFSKKDGFVPQPGDSGAPMLMISKVQVGQKGPSTRLVLYLNRSGNFNFSVNETGTEILLVPSERMRWEAQTSMDYTTGLFKGYELIEQSNKTVLKIKTMPGTKVSTTTLQDGDSSNPKYVMDLASDTITAAPGDAFPMEETSMIVGDTGLIQSMDILTQNDDTIVKFITKEPLNLDVMENEYTNQVVVHLPKINWTNVNVLDKNGGLIDSYKVDQSSKDGTNLILNVQKGTHVIGKKTVSGGNSQSHRFIIHLNQNERKLPVWLVDATTEHTEYEEEHQGEEEVERIAYRGGTTAKATIGQGLYAGWNVGFFGAEDKQEQSNPTASSTLFTGATGAQGEVYVGFGKATASDFYLGGEMSVGYYLNKQTRTQTGATGDFTNTMNLGMTWGGSIRVGGYVAPMALLYARFGVVSTDFWFKGAPSTNGLLTYPSTYSRRNRSGFLYGVGLDAAYNDYTSMRFEVNQTTYQTFDHNGANTANVMNNVKHRFILNQISLGMTHHFRPMAGPAVSPIYEESVVRGLYGGVMFALNNTYAKRDVSNVIAGVKTTYYEGASNTDPIWGFYLGYGKARGRFYYAGEIDIALSESMTKETVKFAGGNTESFVDTLKWRWGTVGRVGYIINHGVVGYGKLGLVSTKLHRENNNTTVTAANSQFAAVKNYKKFLLGVRTGLGLEVAVNRSLGIRSDWTLDYYPKIDIRSASTGREKQALIDNRFGIGLTVYLHDALAAMGLGSHL